MSRIGYYLRVSPAELARLEQESGRAIHTFAYGSARDDARCLCVQQYASEIQILLDEVGLPIDVVRGGVRLCDDCPGGDGIEVFSVAEVRLAAAWFELLSFDELAGGRDMDHVRTYFDGLLQHFGAAAAEGDAILRWFG